MRNLDFEIGSRTEIPASDIARDDVGLTPDNNRRIEKSIQYMEQRLNQPLRASDLATVANVSLSHFFVLFKRATGSAPIDFFIRLRMKQARELLESTSLQVKEIAGELGYCDPLYFSKLFKSVNGVAPTDYRKACHNVSSLGLRWSHVERVRIAQDQPNNFQPASGGRALNSLK